MTSTTDNIKVELNDFINNNTPFYGEVVNGGFIQSPTEKFSFFVRTIILNRTYFIENLNNKILNRNFGSSIILSKQWNNNIKEFDNYLIEILMEFFIKYNIKDIFIANFEGISGSTSFQSKHYYILK